MVNDAELKVKIFRLIDMQDGEMLQSLYQLLLNKLQQQKLHTGNWASLEEGYQAMATAEQSEREAKFFNTFGALETEESAEELIETIRNSRYSTERPFEL